MSYQHVKSSRQHTKERIVRALGGKCALCGYDKCFSALEVHHVDPSKKDFTIAANTNRAYEQISSEIRKCILLCANCHREVHAGLISEQLTPSFDEKIDLEIKMELAARKGLTLEGDKAVLRCSFCGVEITHDSKSGMCPTCYFKTTRRVDRPEREALKELIRNQPFTRIAADYGVTDNAVRKWCDAYDLPRTKTEIKSFTDAEWAEI